VGEIAGAVALIIPGLALCRKVFFVKFGLIYFMGKRRNPSAPDVTRR
jgi:hypothetical protein